MNKYSLRDFLYEKFSSYISTLKDTSFDSENSIYLCNDTSTSNVYDFDKYVKSNFDTSRLPSSPDAIYLGNKKLYFIEFKNQIPSDVEIMRVYTMHDADRHQRAHCLETGDKVQHGHRDKTEVVAGAAPARCAQEAGIDAFEHQPAIVQRKPDQRQAADRGDQQQRDIIDRQY